LRIILRLDETLLSIIAVTLFAGGYRMNATICALRRPFLLLSVIAMLPTMARAAEVFRCEHDGKPTYTDTPCDADAQPISVAEPQTIQAGGGTDLAKVYDERLARERRERVQADTRWLQQHDAARADELRVRNALVEGRVVSGMTQQQVRQLWGEPSDVQLQIDQNTSRERWVYQAQRGGLGRRTVSFENGRVAGAGGGKNAGSAPHKSRRNADDEKKKQDR
jgi:hypothetical protein